MLEEPTVGLEDITAKGQKKEFLIRTLVKLFQESVVSFLVLPLKGGLILSESRIRVSLK